MSVKTTMHGVTIDLQALIGRFLNEGCSTKGTIPLDCGLKIHFTATWSSNHESHVIEYHVDNAMVSCYGATHLNQCHYVDTELYLRIKEASQGYHENIHRTMGKLFRARPKVKKTKVYIKFAEVIETYYLFNRYELFM